MIAGEYAVLFGSGAIIAAIDRSAVCEYSPGPDREFSPCAGLSTESLYRLFQEVVDVCERASIKPLPGRYKLDTSAFFAQDSGQKLGLGSSAAAVVALVKMILCQQSIVDQSLLLNLSLQAHRDFSSGMGSGADVAAAVFASLIHFQPSHPLPIITTLDQDGLWKQLLFIDTLRPQNSRDFIRPVLLLKEKDPVFIHDFCQASTQICAHLLKRDRPESLLIGDVTELFHWVKNLGQRAHVDIVSQAHQAIHDAAVASGGCAKPSGAGGGDFAMAIIPKQGQKLFAKKIGELGFHRWTFKSVLS